ncbi:hypothetical protein C8F01DRAFT_1088409 [Mycena amicta]|nr:hypothetical protein C8F01DRAFT_1088409 [Mycena amicta]
MPRSVGSPVDALSTSTSSWFFQTFLNEYSRSAVVQAFSENAPHIIEELSSVLESHPQLRTDLSARSDDPSDQVDILFRHIDGHAGNKDLVRAFQAALWDRGGARYIMKADLPTQLGLDLDHRNDGKGSSIADQSDLLDPPPHLTGWFPETFQASLPRSRVVHAMMARVGEVVEELSTPTLDPLPAVRAKLLCAENSAEQVNILFELLDAQYTNEKLVSAFQRAVWKRGEELESGQLASGFTLMSMDGAVI